MASDEKRSAVDEILDGPTVVTSDADILARNALKVKAREELRALRAENAAMREALERCLDVLSGNAMSKQELIDALDKARTALGGPHV